MPLYFAYGSNMERAPMAARCPRSRALGVARLMRHRFIVSADGYASIVRDPRGVVWGVLWDLALSDAPALDRYESLATGLYTKAVQPVLTASGPRRAMVYIGRSAERGEPRPGYLEAVLEAAIHAGLPQDYLKELKGWLPHAKREPGPQERPVRPLRIAPEGSILPVRRSR
jgi:hypothetical protein